MAIRVVAVGKSGRLLADAIEAYADKASKYWSFDVTEVREERYSRSGDEGRVRDAEATRILERLSAATQVVALTRTGERWNSTAFARYLENQTALSRDVAFVIGGAYGLGDAVLQRAQHELSLSSLTLAHDLARVLLMEQIYRAGTIVRGEPYHKAPE